MLPQIYDIPDGYDKKATLEWIDSLITKDNLPTILTHYDFLNYRYFRQDNDLDGMPNYHTFIFSPKDKDQITPQRFEYIEKELDRKTLITDPLEEDQDWVLFNNEYIIISLKVTD